MRFAFLIILSCTTLLVSGCLYTHGTFDPEEGETNTLILASLPDGSELLMADTGWLTPGLANPAPGFTSKADAGVIALTKTHVYFLTWNSDMYRVTNTTAICDINSIYHPKAKNGAIFVIVTDRPNHYQILTKAGFPKDESGRKFVELLNSSFCPD